MSLREIDFATWPRRDHFQLYQSLDFPYFSVTLDFDITDWFQSSKAAGLPFAPTLVYEVMRVANAIDAFKLRIRGEKVVMHDQVNPSFTVPWRDELFNFCTIEYHPDRATFLARYAEASAAASAADRLILDEPQRDDMIFLTSSPWFTFTSLTHPVHAAGGDSFPRISWGRRFERDGRVLLPLNFQMHHGLADGVHVARFLDLLKAGLGT